jgi:hypothetical protein
VVVSAPFWPRAGGAIAVALARGEKRRQPAEPKDTGSQP